MRDDEGRQCSPHAAHALRDAFGVVKDRHRIGRRAKQQNLATKADSLLVAIYVVSP